MNRESYSCSVAEVLNSVSSQSPQMIDLFVMAPYGFEVSAHDVSTHISGPASIIFSCMVWLCMRGVAGVCVRVCWRTDGGEEKGGGLEIGAVDGVHVCVCVCLHMWKGWRAHAD